VAPLSKDHLRYPLRRRDPPKRSSAARTVAVTASREVTSMAANITWRPSAVTSFMRCAATPAPARTSWVRDVAEESGSRTHPGPLGSPNRF
jgi:hypothetical protein